MYYGGHGNIIEKKTLRKLSVDNYNRGNILKKANNKASLFKRLNLKILLGYGGLGLFFVLMIILFYFV